MCLIFWYHVIFRLLQCTCVRCTKWGELILMLLFCFLKQTKYSCLKLQGLYNTSADMQVIGPWRWLSQTRPFQTVNYSFQVVVVWGSLILSTMLKQSSVSIETGHPIIKVPLTKELQYILSFHWDRNLLTYCLQWCSVRNSLFNRGLNRILNIFSKIIL